MKKTLGLALTVTLLAPGCLPDVSRKSTETDYTGPRLILFLSVDQARYEYLNRFRPLFQGGFKRLLDQGVRFSNAHHNHAITVTAPGHASLSTGLYPRRSGIISNQWYDRQRKRPVYCVEDFDSPLIGSLLPSSGRSPKNLLGNTLSDWIKKRTPLSKVFTASGKDRSAILLGGKETDAAFWYDKSSGEFVTSQYYLKEYPSWVKEFHARRIPDAHFAAAWEPLPVSDSDYTALGIERPDDVLQQRRFPHALGGFSLFPDASFYLAFYSSPFMDGYLATFARELIENESLGLDKDPDFLGLSFSATDSVGHVYGPNSPEVLDTLLRLDRALGELLDFLDRKVGRDNVAISLSADHGVMPSPEYLGRQELPGGRAGVRDVVCFQAGGKEFETKFGKEKWFLQGLYLNPDALGRHHLSSEEVEKELARLMEQCPLVKKVWTRNQLETAVPGADPYQELFFNSFHSGRSPDLFVQLEEFYLTSMGLGTSHGSAYEYDTHVPLLILFPGISPATIAERVNTVDLTPTLASLLKLSIPEGLDGIDRSHGLTPTRQSAKK